MMRMMFRNSNAGMESPESGCRAGGRAYDGSAYGGFYRGV